MPRPPKSRRVAFLPDFTYFKPAGVPLKMLKEVCLGIEELEAIRLKDLKKLDQESCAEQMGISRPTFHRIITSARYKLAMALVEGKAIRIEGGNYKLNIDHLYCCNCNFRGKFIRKILPPINFENIYSEQMRLECPRCGSNNVKIPAKNTTQESEVRSQKPE